jgi:hypothetical protein
MISSLFGRPKSNAASTDSRKLLAGAHINDPGAADPALQRYGRSCRLTDRDRKGPYSPSLPHHRAYGSVHGGSDSYALLLSDNLGSPMASK